MRTVGAWCYVMWYSRPMYQDHKVAIVTAIGRKRELGRGNELIWRIPADLKRFKELTVGHPVVMGRKTFESILAGLGKPLPGRTNIVITRDPASLCAATETHEHVIVVGSLEEGMRTAAKAPGTNEIHIGGGAEIYAQALPFVDTIYLTEIDAEEDAADSFFPAFEDTFIPDGPTESREWNGLLYRWVTYTRR